MRWTTEHRITAARNIAAALLNEAKQGVVMSRRVAELSELILFALSMPTTFLDANHDKYAEWE